MTGDSPSSIPPRERLRDSKQKIDDIEISEVDNGLINGSQEITRDGFDDVNGTAAVRVRFEIDRKNGVRCDANEQNIDDASHVLTKNWNANDNHSRLEQPAISERQEDLRRTDSERNANDDGADSEIIEKKPAIVDIVQYLVESR